MQFSRLADGFGFGGQVFQLSAFYCESGFAKPTCAPELGMLMRAFLALVVSPSKAHSEFASGSQINGTSGKYIS